jgi:TonB family protein
MMTSKAKLGLVVSCWAVTLFLPAIADEPANCAEPGLVVAPITATHLTPPYPNESQRRHEEGTTIVLVSITDDGTPKDITVAQSSRSERLDNAAVEFGRMHWRWQPPMQDCKPTTAQAHVRVVWHQLKLNFLPPDPDFRVTMPPSAYPPGAIGRLEEGDSLLQIEVD